MFNKSWAKSIFDCSPTVGSTTEYQHWYLNGILVEESPGQGDALG